MFEDVELICPEFCRKTFRKSVERPPVLWKIFFSFLPKNETTMDDGILIIFRVTEQGATRVALNWLINSRLINIHSIRGEQTNYVVTRHVLLYNVTH